MTTVDAPVLDRTKLYVAGAWVDSTGDTSIDVVNPATEQVIACSRRHTVIETEWQSLMEAGYVLDSPGHNR